MSSCVPGGEGDLGIVDVTVLKGGRAIASLSRPLRQAGGGPAVTYRKKLWPLQDGCINIDGEWLEVEAGPDPTQGALFSGDEDPGQAAVLSRPAEARVLVDAGPGTGKTHVACARVAGIIAEGVPPSKIWLISFTRTAVVEIRNRIAATLNDPAAAAGVHVATLDSHAWALQSGFNADAALTGSFDENIEATLRRVEEDEELQTYLGRIRHLVVDEGQDIVGVRAELTLALVAALGPDCGVTVFADEAQAIYGFTEDQEGVGSDGPTLPGQLRTRGFEEIRLDRVHRTGEPGLVTIFTRVRRRVLRRAGGAAARRRAIEADIRGLADQTLGSLGDLDLAALGDKALVLMRRRVDVLELSSRQQTTPHRLRMSGLPACLRPWLAHLFWDHVEPRLGRARFDDLWNDRLAQDDPGVDRETAWRLLVEVAGETAATVDMPRLRQSLGRAGPPMLFCTPEFGTVGPILGTIHASKGREADEVLLCLPPEAAQNAEGMDIDEEIRVMFVGATRARKRLTLAVSANTRAASADGRVWRFISPAKHRPGQSRIRVEIGRAHDLSAEGLVGRRAFGDADAAAAAQRLWRDAPVRTGLTARAEATLDYDFVLETGDGERLGLLGLRVRQDMRAIATQAKRWPPPGFLPFLRTLGARTLVAAPDDPALTLLHEPWSRSGFLLAPLLTGFPPATFRESGK